MSISVLALLFGIVWGFVGAVLFLLKPTHERAFRRAYAEGLRDGPKMFKLFVKAEELKKQGVSYEEFKKEMDADIRRELS